MAPQLDAEELLAAQQEPVLSLPESKTTRPSIPRTPKARLQAARHDHALNADALVQRKGSTAGKDTLSREKTIMYLGYGSNLSSKTFRQSRGITPISQVNVAVPDLMLTFDLPGVPYVEPCFAGTRFRDPDTGKPRNRGKDGSPLDSGDLSIDGEKAPILAQPADGKGIVWPKPLIGVVYEVTLADYAHIIATEGGGASYVDIVVECHPFPADYDPTSPVPDHPSTTPFMAHTLLSPRDSKTPSSHQIRTPYYAQPSPRYKNLLVTGAKEHDLPVAYRDYLSSVSAYCATTYRQKIGRALMFMVWGPWLLFIMGLGQKLADEQGRAPKWLATLQQGLFEGMWWSYDTIFFGVFGDGERCID